MMNETIVALCQEYLNSFNHDILAVLCDALDEAGDSLATNYRNWFEFSYCRYDVTVLGIAERYGATDSMTIPPYDYLKFLLGGYPNFLRKT